MLPSMDEPVIQVAEAARQLKPVYRQTEHMLFPPLRSVVQIPNILG